jgi:hypothetical protein
MPPRRSLQSRPSLRRYGRIREHRPNHRRLALAYRQSLSRIVRVAGRLYPILIVRLSRLSHAALLQQLCCFLGRLRSTLVQPPLLTECRRCGRQGHQLVMSVSSACHESVVNCKACAAKIRRSAQVKWRGSALCSLGASINAVCRPHSNARGLAPG